jgi:catechol 2,3-dioxygenase-like lactoylglutathione lyase family enzyme
MEPRLSFVTLGVHDLPRATRFYAQGLRLKQLKSLPTVSFFDLGSTRLALYPRELLAAEVGMPAPGSGFSGFALAHNVGSPAEADGLLDEAERAGGRIVKPAAETNWGGYAGYFADPDGFLWEVAWNPNFPIQM